MKNLQSNLSHYWATPVYSAELERAEKINADLSDIILLKEKEFAAKDEIAAEIALFFNKFSRFRYAQKFPEWDFECVKIIKDHIVNHTNAFLTASYPSYFGKTVFEAWSNVNRYSDWHGLHSHFTGGAEILSGVYWVKVPEANNGNTDQGGALVLYDPRGPFFPERQKIVITPQAGRIIIFPSWLQHEVTPLKSNEPRISIGFDIKKI